MLFDSPISGQQPCAASLFMTMSKLCSMFFRNRNVAYMYAQKMPPCKSARVVQWIEYRFPKAKALGSNPSSCWQSFRLCHLLAPCHVNNLAMYEICDAASQHGVYRQLFAIAQHTVTRSSRSKSCGPFHKGGAAEVGRQATSSNGVDASSASQILSAGVTYIHHTSSHPNPAAAD